MSGDGTASDIEQNTDEILSETADWREGEEYRGVFKQLSDDADGLDADMQARLEKVRAGTEKGYNQIDLFPVYVAS